MTFSLFPRGRAAWPFLALSLTLAGCEVMGDATGPGDPDPPPDPDQVVCDGSGSVKVGNRTILAAPNGFAAVGNRILRASDCSRARFVGVARPALSFSSDGGRLGVDTAAAADFARIRGWKANTVRIELAQYYWMPASMHYDPGYVARVARVVKQARDAGLFVILALQASDRGDPQFALRSNTQQPLADVNHSIPFWKDVAARYKNDGGILFDVFSEPYPIGGPGGFSNWDLWQKGGLHPEDDVYEPNRKPFQAAGMQQLYDAVRSTGAHNMVIVAGTQWGYFLNGVPSHRIQGYNIAYSTHPWDWPGARQPATWDADWAFLAATDPVMITEFGDYDCTTPYITALLDKADQLGLSWIAWAWVAPAYGESMEQRGEQDPVCNRSLLITDWSGTPSKIGQVIKTRMGSY